MGGHVIVPEVLLYGTKSGESIEDLLSTQAENILPAMFLAKRAGYGSFRIVDYTEAGFEMPDFAGAVRIGGN